MKNYTGRLVEILLESYQNASARIACPPGAFPRPGQYLQIVNPADAMQVVPGSFFAAGANTGYATETQEPLLDVVGPVPERWQPGDLLQLRGPLGRGFQFSKRARRVALVALAGAPGRLLPLAPLALAQGAEVALCATAEAAELPLAVELRGQEDVAEVLAWADYAAIEVEAEQLEDLEQRLGGRLPGALVAEALVLAPMPCGAIARCGVCTVNTTRGQKLACEDGPVFELKQLLS